MGNMGLKQLTDETILDNIQVETTFLFIATGIFVFFALLFVIIYFARKGSVKSIENEYERRKMKKKLLVQCLIGMGIFVFLAFGSLKIAKDARYNIDNYVVKIATVTDKKQNLNDKKTHDISKIKHFVYVQFDGDDIQYKITEPARFDEIKEGDQVYVVVKNGTSNKKRKHLASAAWPVDKYEYVGDKFEE